MNDFFTSAVLIATVTAAIRLATPYLLAGLGEAIGQRSGVLNLGVDGVMLLSAFAAYYTALETDSLLLATLVGVCTGFVMGLIYGLITVVFQAAQGISGIGIYLFGLGFSDLLFQRLVGSPRPTKQLDEIGIPLLSDIPTIGEMFFQHSYLTYFAFICVPLATFLLMKTPFGTTIRAVGENPEAADSLGISVARTRWITILIGNTMAGLAGTALVLDLGIFQGNITSGLGFIAVALVYFGAWRPAGVMAGALLFGFVSSIVLQWKTLGIIPRSASDLASMAPAVVTIVALVVVAQRIRPPAALTKPFSRGG